MKRKKLVIISHTEHYIEEGIPKGWGPTVHEINYLANHWEHVVHIACLYNQKPPLSSVAYNCANITYVPIPAYGGRTFLKKINILFKMPGITRTVKKNLIDASEVQLRVPTAMGLFLLPLFTWIWKRNYTFWVKYAGDWEQERPPRSNGWQRWFLQKKWINFPVTINGFWPNQAPHCFSFENPCLTELNIKESEKIVESKKFEPPFVLTFVGRIDHVKGVDRILSALAIIPKEKIKEIHIIGDGPNKNSCETLAKNLNLVVEFHGYLDRPSVHYYLAKSHFFMLPSSNEGFPKVIAEAACYGTIPVVSNVSSIKHYLNDENGFVWNLKGKVTYSEVVKDALETSSEELVLKANKIKELAKLFTFDHYYFHLCDSVLKVKSKK